ncbi:MAG: 30S ribosomal protein S14 [Bacteroidetes bacterium]|jgi:small subunit ribosomal protein S14|nr:30S ribosomal protein S14 [Bacteroidota bacterium]
MAKKSWIAREKKRRRMVAKYRAKRNELREKGDQVGLQKLPRNSNPVRLNNRCPLTGRTRGFLRDFGVSRIAFRDLALEGKIPGVRKSSW